ncbi:MAG: CotH kinase family protein [Bacteroidales bacterium]|nr:CotH kinase family protein [Bacteroidales bacterium]
MKKIIFAIFVFLPILLNSQTFNGNTGTISPSDTSFFSIDVSGLSPATIDTVFGLEWLKISLNCDNTYNLTLFLVAPDGNEIILANRCTNSSAFTDTYFYDQAYFYINEGWGEYSDYFRPDENIGDLNNGQIGNGIWTLKIVNHSGNAGSLSDLSLNFSDNPSRSVNFESSNLPIILINTLGQTIPDEPKIYAFMQIIHNGNGNLNYLSDIPAFEGNIGIETRGSSSQWVSLKKSYGIETYKEFGVDTSVSIFGMPAEEDWVLIANFSDKSLMRNALSYELSRQMGNYASRTKFVEVFINGHYRGVYMFAEKIKRDAGRVDIAKLNPDEITGDELTGGYILKIDKTTGGDEGGFVSPFFPINHPYGQIIYYQYEYPKGIDIVQEQKDYIKNYVVDSFETALNSTYYADPEIGFRKYADDKSFMDYFFINEISKNVDGYRISTFLHKDKFSNGGKIIMGPVWDFDIAWHNANYCDAEAVSGWAFQFPCDNDGYQPPFWWEKFFTDTIYCYDMHNRWTFFRENVLSDENILGVIDSFSNEIYEAQYRNFEKWNILGRYVWPNPSPLANTYDEEIENLQSWIVDRLEWLDLNLPDPELPISNKENLAEKIIIYPNPTNLGYFILNFDEVLDGDVFISILDISGRIVFNQLFENQSDNITITTDGFSQGIYFVTIENESKNVCKKLIIN